MSSRIPVAVGHRKLPFKSALADRTPSAKWRRRRPDAVSQPEPRTNGGHPGILHPRFERLPQWHCAPSTLVYQHEIVGECRAKRGVPRARGLPCTEKPIQAGGASQAFQSRRRVDGARFDEKIRVNFPRQETTHLDVGGIFKKSCRKKQFNQCQTALVVRRFGRSEFCELFAGIILRIETVTCSVLQPHQ